MPYVSDQCQKKSMESKTLCLYEHYTQANCIAYTNYQQIDAFVSLLSVMEIPLIVVDMVLREYMLFEHYHVH